MYHLIKTVTEAENGYVSAKSICLISSPARNLNEKDRLLLDFSKSIKNFIKQMLLISEDAEFMYFDSEDVMDIKSNLENLTNDDINNIISIIINDGYTVSYLDNYGTQVSHILTIVEI